MSTPSRRPLSTFALLALLALPVTGSAAETASEQVQGGRDPSARLTVPVTINGGGPYAFVVDTGAERTVISRELADRLTLSRSARVTVASIAGNDEVDTALVPHLQFAASRGRLADIQAPVLAEAHLGAVGMLGVDSLQRKRVILDFKAMRMSIADASERQPRSVADEIVVEARRRSGQLILVDAAIDGQSVSVVVDTGSAVTIANAALRRRLERRGLPGVRPILITSVTGETVSALYTSVGDVRIGGVRMGNMPIAFADARIFHRLGLDRKPALLLGMDVLKLFDRVSIDFANRKVRFLLPGDALQAPPSMLAAILPAHRG